MCLGPVRKADDDNLKPAGVPSNGLLIKYGLDDWKVSLPIGLAMAVPFLANEVSGGGPAVGVWEMDGLIEVQRLLHCFCMVMW